jgi:uncharacterized protein (DUF2249 family)
MNPTTESTDSAYFDVREIPCRIKHGQILQRWNELHVGAHFILVNDHDPIPLRHQFNAEFPGAVSWEYLERGPEVFQVKITKLDAVARARTDRQCPSATAPAPANTTADLLEIDTRGSEPPEPLMRILDALENLPPGKRLKAVTDRWPCHLFGEAEQRGFRHECTEQPDGFWITLLERV